MKKLQQHYSTMKTVLWPIAPVDFMTLCVSVCVPSHSEARAFSLRGRAVTQARQLLEGCTGCGGLSVIAKWLSSKEARRCSPYSCCLCSPWPCSHTPSTAFAVPARQKRLLSPGRYIAAALRDHYSTAGCCLLVLGRSLKSDQPDLHKQQAASSSYNKIVHVA